MWYIIIVAFIASYHTPIKPCVLTWIWHIMSSNGNVESESCQTRILNRTVTQCFAIPSSWTERNGVGFTENQCRLHILDNTRWHCHQLGVVIFVAGENGRTDCARNNDTIQRCQENTRRSDSQSAGVWHHLQDSWSWTLPTSCHQERTGDDRTERTSATSQSE